jgi:hypothetical protein
MKARLNYDDQDKDSHLFATLVPGGHGDSLSDYRGNPHLRFAAEAAMVQECCCGDLWRNGVKSGGIMGEANGIRFSGGHL